jgi:leucyl aminopeptidase
MTNLLVLEVVNPLWIGAPPTNSALQCAVLMNDTAIAQLPLSMQHAVTQASGLVGQKVHIIASVSTSGPLPLLLVQPTMPTPRKIAQAVKLAISRFAPAYNGALEIVLVSDHITTLSLADTVCAHLGPALWRYQSAMTPLQERPLPLTTITVIVSGTHDRQFIGPGCIAGQMAQSAMTLVAAPPNLMQPQAFAAQATHMLANSAVTVQIYDAAVLHTMGFGLTLAIGGGATHAPPCVVEARYNGDPNGPDAPPVVLIGKGVTFDSGGTSLKAARNMHNMKSDMAGAATVMATLAAVAQLKLPLNVVALAGMIENMPGGSAARPGDVARSVGGTTVEIINTDAEGRLVMADLLHYSARLQPRVVVDIATLTGSCVVALGHMYGALFTETPQLRTALLRAAHVSSNALWAMPLGDSDFRQELRSEVADLQNVNDKVPCGHIYAAAFLREFVPPGVPWAHIDSAGMMYDSHGGIMKRGAPTGWGVALLVQALVDGAL